MTHSDVDFDTLIGARIARADSSLRNFAIALTDGRGIHLEAVDAEGDPVVRAAVVSAQSLPDRAEAVCSVDWSWIYGSTISKVTCSLKMVRLHLEPAGPLIVSVGLWQSSPFLSFQPFRPAK